MPNQREREASSQRATMQQHPLWTRSSTNTIKRDSFKSKSSSSGLNSLYSTFNIEEPVRPHKEKENSNNFVDDEGNPVFTLESLFGSSQNTSVDGGSLGTDVSDGGSRKSESFMVGRHSDRRRRKSDVMYRHPTSASARRDTKSYKIPSNSQTIHNMHDITNNYPNIASNSRNPASRTISTSGSTSSSIGDASSKKTLTSTSLPKLQGDGESESIPEEQRVGLFDDDLPYDLRSTGTSVSLDSRKRTSDNMSIATSIFSAQYSRKWRVGIALLVGGVLIALCLLGFYLNAESRKAEYHAAAKSRADKDSSAADDHAHGGTGSTVEQQGGAGTGYSSTRLNKWRTAGACKNIERSCPPGYSSPLVLLIAIDGLRPDMISASAAPALHHLTQCGASARHLTPVYPSSTAPNLYTLVTGLYPESHGIIGSEMYSTETGGTFKEGKYNSYNQPFWWEGEPVWNTIKSKGLRSAMYFWPGSDVQLAGGYPTYWYKYRDEYPLDTRVNMTLEWLLYEEEERPSLLGLYFDYPDKVAREEGPFTLKANRSLLEVDGQIDRLMATLEERQLTSCVDVMVVSGHGMAEATCGGSLYLETFMEDIKKKARVVSGAVGRLQAKAGKASNKEILQQLRCKNPKLRALSKDLLPVRYHYGNHKRIEDVILDTLPHNRVVTSESNYCVKAEHGFNNIETAMQGVFMASGPSFKSGYQGRGFSSVELYNLLCTLLGVQPAHNNGTEGSLYGLLKQPPSTPNVSIDAWHENLLPFLHQQAREKAFLEVLVQTTKQPTTTTAATTPSATLASASLTLASTAATPSAAVTTAAVTNAEATAATTAASPAVPASASLTLASTAATTSAAAASTTDAAPASISLTLASTAAPTSTVAATTAASVSSTVQASTAATSATAADSNAAPEASTKAAATTAASMTPATVTDRAATTTTGSTKSTSDTIPASDQNSTNREAKMSVEQKQAVAEKALHSTTVLENEGKENVAKVDDSMPDMEDSTHIVGTIIEMATTGSISVSMGEETSAGATLMSTSSTQPSTVEMTVKPASNDPNSAVDSTTAAASAVDIPDRSTTASATTSQSNDVSATTELITPEVPKARKRRTATQTKHARPEAVHSAGQNLLHTVDSTNAAATRNKRDVCDCTSTKLLQSASVRGKVSSREHVGHHCPYGIPLFSAPDAPKGTHYILPHQSHVTGYVGELGTALWTSFTLTNDTLQDLGDLGDLGGENIKQQEGEEGNPCWMADPRLPRNTDQQCSEYLEENRYSTDTLSIRQLFPIEFESPDVQSQEGFFLSNAIALRSGFVSSGRRSIMTLLQKWVRARGVVNVLTGPVWDRNMNGIVDTIIHIRSRVDYLIPSHVFYLISSCDPASGFDAHERDLSSCPLEDLQTMAFVLPNTDLNDNCLMSDGDYCRYHLSSIADLQRLTGLTLLSSFQEDAALPALLAQQPLHVW